jgi:hypothetical protein
MCLIIHKPAKVDIPEEQLITAWKNNSDGMGIMVPLGGRVHVHRTIPKTEDEVLKLYNKFKNRSIGIHFRWRTHGKIDKINTHPYKVLTAKKDGVDLYLMHNGVIRAVEATNPDLSDTWHYVQFLRPFIVKYGPEILDSEVFRDLIENHVGSNNKLLLVNSKGDWHFINKQAGSESKIDGCWCSNEYSLKESYRQPYKPYKPANTNTNNSNHLPYSQDTQVVLNRVRYPTSSPYTMAARRYLQTCLNGKDTTQIPKSPSPKIPKVKEAKDPEGFPFSKGMNLNEMRYWQLRKKYGNKSHTIADVWEMDVKELLKWILTDPTGVLELSVDLMLFAKGEYNQLKDLVAKHYPPEEKEKESIFDE